LVHFLRASAGKLNSLRCPECVTFSPPSPSLDTGDRDFCLAFRRQHDAQIQDAVLLGANRLFTVEQKDRTTGLIDRKQPRHRAIL
jgi:hypothetical protein